MAEQQKSQSDRHLIQARRMFFEQGGAPVGKVPDTIMRSWLRCQRSGLSSKAAPRIEPAPFTRLKEMRERHEKLWRLVRAELELLATDAAATGSIVTLSDADGWILDAEGSAAFLDRAGRVALMPGACWNESHVGTNAIGTAIVEGRSVVVHGGQHYLAAHGILSCSASPIFDPYGMRVGVLDISGDANVQHMHALGLARLAVANIEDHYFDDGIPDSELLRLHPDPALLGTAREGLLAFRHGRLVAANQVGLQLFGLDRSDLGHASYAALFDQALTKLRDDGVLLDRQGRALYGRVDDGQPRPRRSTSRGSIAAPAANQSPQSDAPLFDPNQEAELARACRVLDAGLSVLVQGETGAGKEVFARELHRRCTRASKPFVAVNCAALPESLIEAELFGYEAGAFTGARKNGNPGLLRQADGGVLFLDEIGDMPLALQPRLLRVLQERELLPLGGGKPIKLDFALVCATHRELETLIDDERFRADLYYRIAHHTVRMSPLRAIGDRVALVKAMWQRLGQGRVLTEAASTQLANYSWPGNLRQLNACLRTLVALSEPGARIGIEMLPGYVRNDRPAPATIPPLTEVVESLPALAVINQAAMRQALRESHGNVSQAARKLGISRSTLYRRLGEEASGKSPTPLSGSQENQAALDCPT